MDKALKLSQFFEKELKLANEMANNINNNVSTYVLMLTHNHFKTGDFVANTRTANDAFSAIDSTIDKTVDQMFKAKLPHEQFKSLIVKISAIYTAQQKATRIPSL